MAKDGRKHTHTHTHSLSLYLSLSLSRTHLGIQLLGLFSNSCNALLTTQPTLPTHLVDMGV